MAKLLKLRRGTTSQHGSFTGAEGEVTVDTDKETVVVHDGSTAGGHPVAAEDMANVSSASIVGRLGTGSIVKAKLEADAIDGTKLADDAVNSEHYVDASIDHQHLSNDCIDGDNIQDDVVNSEHIAAGAVDLEHMSSESVDEDNLKISNAGTNGQFLSKQSGDAGGLTWATPSTTAAEATNVTVSANNSTDETVYPTFVDGATGSQGIETDTGLTYNPSTGLLTAVGLTLSGDLTVNGTTTTINSTTLAVDDKNIELGTVDTPSDTTADGGGITLKGATDKKITWDNTQNSWIFNQDIVVETGALTVKGTEGGNANIYLNADEADDNADYWKIQHLASDNTVIFQNYTTGGYTTTLKLNPNGALEDSKGDVRKIPLNNQTSAYVPVASDSGKVIHIQTGGITINTSVMLVGDVITIINNSGSDQTITQGSGFTMYNSGDGSTGNRTLGARGMATLWYGAHDWGYISGAGLS